MQYQADQHLQYMTTCTQAGNLSLSNHMHAHLSNNTYIHTYFVGDSERDGGPRSTVDPSEPEQLLKSEDSALVRGLLVYTAKKACPQSHNVLNLRANEYEINWQSMEPSEPAADPQFNLVN